MSAIASPMPSTYYSDISIDSPPSGVTICSPGARAHEVAVLFTQRDSVYLQLGADCWDRERDARRYPGGKPVVAHPPCRAWGQLSHMAKPEPGERELALFAIDMVRRYGGVLEHPQASRLFPAYLPLPGAKDAHGGYSISVNQSWFGHRCEKRTLLYIVGCPERELPPIPLSLDAITHVIGTSGRRRDGSRNSYRPEATKREREATPIAMAKWLLATALLCGQKNHLYPVL